MAKFGKKKDSLLKRVRKGKRETGTAAIAAKVTGVLRKPTVTRVVAAVGAFWLIRKLRGRGSSSKEIQPTQP